MTTGSVDTNTVGSYTIHYNVSDTSGNAATEVTRTVNVTTRAITVTAATNTKVYDGTTAATTSAPTITSGTLATGDTSTFIETFDTKNVGTGKTLTPSGTIKNGSNVDVTAKYAITFTPVTTGVITTRSITVTAAANSKVYSATLAAAALPTVTSGALATGDVGTFSEVYTSVGVGTGKTLVPSGTIADALSADMTGNYTITFTSSTNGTITAKNLTISGAVAADKTYDGNATSTVSFTSATLVGVVGLEDVSINSTGYAASFTNKNVGVGKSVTVTGVTLSGADAGNYTVSQPAGLTATISQRNLTVTAQVDSKTYDGSTSSSVAPLMGALQGSDTVTTAATQSFDTKNVGTSKTLTASGLVVNDGNSGLNYNVGYVTNTSGAITACAITVTASANSRVYDGGTTAAALPTITSGTLATGDIATLAEHYSIKNVGTNKTLIPTGTIADALSANMTSNYAITFTSSTNGVITTAPLTISSLSGVDKTYDATTTANISGTGALVGLADGDSVSITGTASATFSDKNVGTGKAITVTGLSITGDDAANYTVSQPTGLTAAITTRPITVTAAATSKTYDGGVAASSTPTVTVGTLATGDIATFSETYDNKNVGTGHVVTPSGTIADVLSANMTGNYAITFSTISSGVITARAITVTAAVSNRIYDAGTTSTSTPTVTSGTLVSGDVGTFTETYDTKVVGTEKTMTPAGTIADALSANMTGNYAITFTTSTNGTVTANNLTISGAVAANKTYDGNATSTVSFTSAALATISGSDDVTINSSGYEAVFANGNVGTGKAVTVTGVTLGGADAGNYTVSQPSGLTANITQVALAVTAANKSKEFGATDPTLTYTLTSGAFVSGDAFTGSLTRTAGESVGTTTINQGTLTAGSNYSIAFTSGVFTIQDTTGPVITLGGTATTTVAIGNTFTDLGATATDAVDGSVTPVKTGTVDTNVAGTYTLTYTATDAHSNVSSKTRDVVVSATEVGVTTTTNGDGTETGLQTNAATSTATGSGVTMTVAMPANLSITGPSGWDGSVNLPTVTTSFTLTPDTGNTASAVSAIEVGFGDTPLTLDKAVKLTFAGQAGKLIGWSQAGAFHQITATCDNATEPTLAAGTDCKINVGDDLIVWTKHFTTFIAYTQTSIPPVVSSGGGGGAISGPLSPGFTAAGGSTSGTTNRTGGIVLGSSTYAFGVNLRFGMKHKDVIELQKFLIAAGFLKVAAPTNYFGPLTLAAVKKYQAAKNISPVSGYVGPLTRTSLNKGL